MSDYRAQNEETEGRILDEDDTYYESKADKNIFPGDLDCLRGYLPAYEPHDQRLRNTRDSGTRRLVTCGQLCLRCQNLCFVDARP